jgi:hypothetical protein
VSLCVRKKEMTQRSTEKTQRKISSCKKCNRKIRRL